MWGILTEMDRLNGKAKEEDQGSGGVGSGPGEGFRACQPPSGLGLGDTLQFPKEYLAGALRLFRAPEVRGVGASKVSRMSGNAHWSKVTTYGSCMSPCQRWETGPPPPPPLSHWSLMLGTGSLLFGQWHFLVGGSIVHWSSLCGHSPFWAWAFVGIRSIGPCMGGIGIYLVGMGPSTLRPRWSSGVSDIESLLKTSMSESQGWNIQKGCVLTFKEKLGYLGEVPFVPTLRQLLPTPVQVLHCQHLDFLQLHAAPSPTKMSSTSPAAPGDGPMHRRPGTAPPLHHLLGCLIHRRSALCQVQCLSRTMAVGCGCASDANELRANLDPMLLDPEFSRLPDRASTTGWPQAPTQLERARMQRGELIGNQQPTPATPTQGEERQHQPQPPATRPESQEIIDPAFPHSRKPCPQ